MDSKLVGEENESIEGDTIKELISLRNYLERRIREVKEESEKLTTLFKIVDEVIVTKSFKKAEVIPISTPELSPRPKFKEEIPLKTSLGIPLATVYVRDEEARIVPAKEMAFSEHIPPFQSFLITRILKSMKKKDDEDIQRDMIMPDQVFSYETISEGDIIKELIIKNYRTKRRLREIISAARWTFDKMYEKTHVTNSI